MARQCACRFFIITLHSYFQLDLASPQQFQSQDTAQDCINKDVQNEAKEQALYTRQTNHEWKTLDVKNKAKSIPYK